MKDITADKTPLLCPTSVALGVFDGVHLGHRLVIDKAVSLSGGEIRSAVFTFRSDTVVNKGSERLLSDKDKHRRISQRRVDYICSPAFDEVRDMSACEFAEKILKERLCCRFAVCGRDFRFGKGAAGDAELLKKLGESLGFETVILDKLAFHGETVSSTFIKELIRKGEIARANEMLGYRFSYREKVVHGQELGRTWDFPTINQPLPKGVTVPRFGVYASRVKINGQSYIGVTNIGVKPTVRDRGEPLAETYILDFNGDLYGETVQVGLERFIRPERRFASVAELREQIAADTAEAARARELGR